MTADELRQAASTLRLRATAADDATGGWFHSGALIGFHEPENALFIETMSPQVVLLLATAIEDHAQEHDCFDCGWVPCHLVTFARAINGGAA